MCRYFCISVIQFLKNILSANMSAEVYLGQIICPIDSSCFITDKVFNEFRISVLLSMKFLILQGKIKKSMFLNWKQPIYNATRRYITLKKKFTLPVSYYYSHIYTIFHYYEEKTRILLINWTKNGRMLELHEERLS